MNSTLPASITSGAVFEVEWPTAKLPPLSTESVATLSVPTEGAGVAGDLGLALRVNLGNARQRAAINEDPAGEDVDQARRERACAGEEQRSCIDRRALDLHAAHCDEVDGGGKDNRPAAGHAKIVPRLLLGSEPFCIWPVTLSVAPGTAEKTTPPLTKTGPLKVELPGRGRGDGTEIIRAGRIDCGNHGIAHIHSRHADVQRRRDTVGGVVADRDRATGSGVVVYSTERSLQNHGVAGIDIVPGKDQRSVAGLGKRTGAADDPPSVRSAAISGVDGNAIGHGNRRQIVCEPAKTLINGLTPSDISVSSMVSVPPLPAAIV